MAMTENERRNYALHMQELKDEIEGLRGLLKQSLNIITDERATNNKKIHFLIKKISLLNGQPSSEIITELNDFLQS